MPRHTPHHESAAALVAAVMRQPSTVRAVVLSLGLTSGSATQRVRKSLEAFRSQGVMYHAGWRYCNAPIYAMQPEPFKHPDAPRPKKSHPAKPQD